MVAFILITICGVALFLRQNRQEALLFEQSRMLASLVFATAPINQELRETNTTLASDAQRLVLFDAAGHDIHTPRDANVLREALIQQVSTLPSAISMSVLDSNGNWIISSRYSRLPAIPHNNKRPIWHAALRTASSQSFVLAPADSPTVGLSSIVVGRPSRAADGRILGAILAFLSVDELERSFSNMTRVGTQISLARPDGTVLVGLPQSASRIPDWMLPLWRDALQKGTGDFKATDPNGKIWLVAVSGSSDATLVFTAVNPADAVLKNLKQYEWTVMATTAIGLCVAIALFGLWLRQTGLTHQKAAVAIAAREQLLRTLSHDPVTQLFNRAGLEQAWRRGSPSGPAISIHFIGIDRFQTIQNVLGHAVTEQMLALLAGRLRGIIGPCNLAARIDSGEFCVVQYAGQTDTLASEIQRRLSERYRLGERDFLLGVSIGVVELNDAAEHEAIAPLLRDGSTAMYRARLGGVGRYCKFDPQADRASQEKILIEQELRAAVGTDQLYMVYQPIYHLASDRVAGFEALMRWNNPTRGLVPPDIFIPIAESAGLLLPVESMVKRSPLRAASDWADDLFVSINCSAIEFRDQTLAQRVRKRLLETGVDARRCFIELTESALVEDDETVLAVMEELREIGVRLALDDFGTGHAGLSYLHRFPFDRIKIDKSFVQAMNQTPVAAAIVDATMALSRQLNLQVVAEGVETRAHLDQLRAMGCTYVQGYLIGRPMDENEIAPFLQRFTLAAA